MNFKKITALLVFVCLLLSVASGCTPLKTAMEYEGETVTLNMYSYWMSQIKSNYVSSSNDNDEYWSTTYSNGETYEEKMREIVDFNVKINLVCQKLFKDMGLKMPEKDVKEMQTGLDDLVFSYGSKSELNAMLALYGINYNMLKEIYEIELKTSTVYDALYGEGGERRIDDEALDTYFKENYRLIDMIMIYSKTEYKKDSEGKLVFDEQKGSYATVELTEEQTKTKNALAESIMSKLESGESFETLKSEYNEDPQGENFKDGYYISSNDISVYGSDIVVAASGLQVGETKKITDGNIIYIMKRRELKDKPYADEAYGDQFENLLSYCEQADFNGYMEELIKGVKVYDDVVSEVSVKKAPLMGY